MNNIIDSIRVSGVTYTISGQSSGGNPTVELTQAEYDALVSAGTVSADTFYIITDATPVETSGFVQTSAITSAVTTASTDSQIPTAKAVKTAVDNAKILAQNAAIAVANQYTDNKLSEFSGITDAAISAATSGKVETSAITSAVTSSSTDSQIPTAKAVKEVVDSAKTSARVAAVYEANQYTDNKLSEFSGITDTSISAATSGKADTSALTTYFGAVAYDSNSKRINFYNTSTGGTVLAYVDATDFIKDGMVDNVEIKDVTLSGQSVTCLVVTFNTDSGKEDINIPITEIFNANNYYTKTEVNGAISAATSGKADSSTVEYINEKVNDVYSSYVNYITSSVHDNYVGLQYGQDGSSLNEATLFGVGEGLNIDYDYDWDYNKITIDTDWFEEYVLAPVATSGDYDDLNNKPTIPTVPTSNSAFTNDAGYATSGYVDASVSGKADSSAVTAVNNALTAHTANTTVHVTSTDKTNWDGAVTALGGLKFIKLTQAQYNALAPNYDSNTIYFIKD